MRFSPTFFAVIFSAALAAPSYAVEPIPDPAVEKPAVSAEKPSLVDRATSSLKTATNSVQTAIDDAIDLIGIRYKRGGQTPETGFDCSGFVRHVFQEGMGLLLPRSAKEISKEGEVVKRTELQPGDLVFFNTMRKTFSHVGIYLGDNQFIHSPRTGGAVRIEDLREKYWAKRYEGARRVSAE
ncbi:MAG TPA: C40 family peptidase [Rhodocyclaceae bacterium]|nr:C40 family peptidase [Rhodocyclaceae bacterium]